MSEAGVATELGALRYCHVVEVKPQRKLRVVQGPCHQQLAKVQRGLQSRKRRGNRLHMR